MHILVLPSEEYIPKYSPLAGVFQQHQISVLLEKSSYQLGVISINLKISLPMIVKALVFHLIGKKVNNDLCVFSVTGLLKHAVDKLYHVRKFISVESALNLNIVRVEGLYYFPPSDKTDYVSWVKAGLSAYEVYVEKFGVPDILHAHNALNAGLLAHQINLRYRVKYVLTEHSSYYYQGMVPENMYRRVAQSISNAACFTVVSKRLKDSLLDTIGQEASAAICLPNVLPPLYERQNISDSINTIRAINKIIFLSVGNLLPVKGHENVIRAFSEVVDRHQNVVLRIVGDGPLRKELEALAIELKVNEKIVFVGEVDATTVRSEMLGADIFVFPSLFETFGVALIEAMSCGLPVISTACGGPDSIVNDETGLLVEPENLDAMQQAMEWMLDNRDKYNASTIRHSVVSRFGGEHFFQKIDQIYSEIVGSDKIVN